MQMLVELKCWFSQSVRNLPGLLGELQQIWLHKFRCSTTVHPVPCGLNTGRLEAHYVHVLPPNPPDAVLFWPPLSFRTHQELLRNEVSRLTAFVDLLGLCLFHHFIPPWFLCSYHGLTWPHTLIVSVLSVLWSRNMIWGLHRLFYLKNWLDAFCRCPFLYLCPTQSALCSSTWLLSNHRFLKYW